MQTQKRKRYQKDAAPSDDIITLIHLVRQNPALYNYKLQPNQRRRSDILNGWSQIAMQIGNKYTVQECRRKWKNLRDTYHQYRLRKPKVGDGLSKWRYAKELDFLSNVYQPKLKSHRLKYDQNFGIDAMTTHGSLTEMHPSHEQHDDDDDDGSGIVHNSDITLVSDDAETFILTAYEESVNDDVVAIDHDSGEHEDGEMSIELSHDDNVDDVGEIVKQEHVISSLDEDGATGAEVDYEEVCMYEEAGNAPSVDSETIIGGGTRSPNDSKAFQYINTTEFCIEPVTISTHSHVPCNNGSNSNGSNGCSLKQPNVYKTISVLAPNPSSTAATTVATAAATTSASNVGGGNCGTIFGGNNTIMQLQPAPPPPPPTLQTVTQTRDELDLFFEFLKNKMQRLPQVDITGIQIEFLNCVLRREADAAQKSAMAP